MIDDYQIDMVRQRRAELDAQLGVLDAQQKLRFIYGTEIDEIDAFLAAVEASLTEGNWAGEIEGKLSPDVLILDDPHNKEQASE